MASLGIAEALPKGGMGEKFGWGAGQSRGN